MNIKILKSIFEARFIIYRSTITVDTLNVDLDLIIILEILIYKRCLQKIFVNF